MLRCAIDRSVAGPLIALLALLLSAPAAAVDFTAEEKAALARGEVVRQEIPDNGKGGYYGGAGWAVIDAPAEEIWAAIHDWESYPRIFPNTVEAKAVSRKGGNILLRMKLGHPLISVVYHVQMTPLKAKWTLKFKLVKNMPSDLDEIQGYWRLIPMPGGRTLVAYVLGVQVPSGIDNVLPDSFKRATVVGLLGVPDIMRRWMRGPGKDRYKAAGAPNSAR